jgi:hypothetical protein
MVVGILAFGSLADEPGDELEARVARRVDGVSTPFSVEFARSSSSRGGAPTLVPVAQGGAPVVGSVFVLGPDVDEDVGRDLLYRRETHNRQLHAAPGHPTWIHALRDFAGVDVCLYTELPANLDQPTPSYLAELAATSAAGNAGRAHRDGISYLDAQLRRGVDTPLALPYARAVLAITGARNLKDAWQYVRHHPERFITTQR